MSASAIVLDQNVLLPANNCRAVSFLSNHLTKSPISPKQSILFNNAAILQCARKLAFISDLRSAPLGLSKHLQQLPRNTCNMQFWCDHQQRPKNDNIDNADHTDNTDNYDNIEDIDNFATSTTRGSTPLRGSQGWRPAPVPGDRFAATRGSNLLALHESVIAWRRFEPP